MLVDLLKKRSIHFMHLEKFANQPKRNDTKLLNTGMLSTFNYWKKKIARYLKHLCNNIIRWNYSEVQVHFFVSWWIYVRTYIQKIKQNHTKSYKNYTINQNYTKNYTKNFVLTHVRFFKVSLMLVKKIILMKACLIFYYEAAFFLLSKKY